ncbi:helix-turn-helix transcriptional regulator [Amycolatopsis rubida]|uniref:Helix-turn-helix transcriptional regulator n=1 Tax=Amycolatopsis rubida TaxID=112413 RepID=A0ABX0BSL0_9PSEU|nr:MULTISPECIES: TetR/AcrR family transcriptional regulator [Amycolatopsis]MYW92951.1 TetR family transcriptional regulator [Amycolatopsis rubida]NEC57938.1 helix-turn-helix transcriptional regulator [Amycolatopsis rubida]
MAGLRESWRLAAMRTIQERALDLFDERGFAPVKIEDVAEAAGVSPSSIYRYFGTKEGLIVADEFDTWGQETIETVLDGRDPVGSLIEAVVAYEAPRTSAGDSVNPSADIPWRRIRYFFTEPSVRLAAQASLDRASQLIVPILASSAALSPTQARVAANSLAFGYFACLEQWYLDDRARPIAWYVEEGLRPLRELSQK